MSGLDPSTFNVYDRLVSKSTVWGGEGKKEHGGHLILFISSENEISTANTHSKGFLLFLQREDIWMLEKTHAIAFTSGRGSCCYTHGNRFVNHLCWEGESTTVPEQQNQKYAHFYLKTIYIAWYYTIWYEYYGTTMNHEWIIWFVFCWAIFIIRWKQC